MKRLLISTAVLALLATGCQNEVLVEQSQPNEGQLFTLEVGRSIESRTELSGTATHWSTTDAIYVSGLDGDVHGILKFVDYVGGDNAKAKFSGIVVGGKPSELEHIVFPVPVGGKIDMAARTGGKLDAPMIGTINGGAVETLKNVGGLLAIKLEDGTDITGWKVNATEGQNNMTGGYYTFTNGELVYTPANNPTPVYGSNGFVFVPVATNPSSTPGEKGSSKVNVTILNNDGIVSASNKPVEIKEQDIIGDSDTEQQSFNMNATVVNEVSELTSAVATGGYIKLNNNLTISNPIKIANGNTVIIDLNGFDITSTTEDVFIVETKSTLTINGNDESVVTAGLKDGCAVWANGGTVVINGGHYKAVPDENNLRCDCIYAGYNKDGVKTSGHITINGGKFEYTGTYFALDDNETGYNVNADGDLHLLNCANADANLGACQIVVNGGQFKNHVPGYEPYAENGEVILGTNKKVYFWDMDNATIGQEITEKDYKKAPATWYIVK